MTEPVLSSQLNLSLPKLTYASEEIQYKNENVI